MTRVLVAALIVISTALLATRSTNEPEPGPMSVPPSEDLAGEQESLPPPMRVQDLNRARYPGIVIDPEGRLEYFAGAIVSKVAHQRKDLGVDLNVVVFSSADVSAATLADQIFELRQIGRYSPTGGILIVINPARSQARIQVSYSLEGALPDALLGRMAADQLDPYISYDAMGMGVMDTVELLERHLYLQAVKGKLDLSEEFRAATQFKSKVRFYSGGAGAQIELSSIPTDVDFKRRVEDEQRALYTPSSDPLKSAEALMRSYRDFAGDPTLEIFTPGTQIMNSFYPFAPFEKLERLYAREASRPLRAIVREDRAVVTSDSPAKGFVPILLKRINGVWRVDDVELWKNLTTTSDWRTIQRTENPYSFGLGAFGKGRKRDLAAWNLQGHDTHEVVELFGKRTDALGRYLYADLLVRNAWAFVPALRAYEEAAAMAPDAPAFWETLGDRASYAGARRRAIKAYERLGPEGKVKIMRAWSSSGAYPNAESLAREVLEEDPYRLPALRTLEHALRKQSRTREANQTGRRIEELRKSRGLEYRPLTLTFSPERPALQLDGPKRLDDGSQIYDYSDFSVTITNTSGRSVEVLKVECEQKGTAGKSSLGEIVQWWAFDTRSRLLEPGASTTLSRSWGFDHDTDHDYVAHVFHYCWRGKGENRQQCGHTRIDQFPL